MPKGAVKCEECDFDLEIYNQISKHYNQKEDPTVPEDQISGLVDNPIFTLIFGLLSLILTLLFITNTKFVVIYLIGVVVLVLLTFRLAKKPAKIRLIPARNVGKGMAYASISLIVFKIIFDLIGALFF